MPFHLPDILSDALTLPADDRRPAHRAKQLAEAREAYPYTYDKPNLRGVAMCADLPKHELPTIEWLVEVGKVLAELGANGVAQAAEAQASELETQDADALFETLKEAGQDGLVAALETAKTMARPEEPHGRAGQLADFARLFQATRVPDLASEIQLDSTFARLRVAGSNPAWFRQVAPSGGLPDDFAVTDAHYRAAVGGPDSLADARSEGRLFIAEYRELLGARAGSLPVPPKIELDYAADPAAWDAAYQKREAAYADGEVPKYVCAPLALFARPADGRSLVPVAIQLFPSGWQGERYRVFTPRDGAAWLAAKSAVQTADGNVHEAVSHLALTHLVQEAFALAMHNCLAPRHPLNRLLTPHFEGTLLINSAADASLVAPAGSVDTLLSPTIGETVRISAAARTAFDFGRSILPTALAERGVLDAAVLPDYPYRDDALLTWQALHTWVETYVQRYYANDAAVVGDVELQAFVQQVEAYRTTDAANRPVGGGVKGVAEKGGRVVTRAYLARMLTQIIFNGSAQHAAVNFPQADLMSYGPAYPLCQLAAGPDGSKRFTDADYLAQLPDLGTANLQINIAKLLGGVHANRLGHYGRRGLRAWFSDDAIEAAEAAFRTRLDAIESEIDARNRHRPRYEHLLPSRIPQSIDI